MPVQEKLLDVPISQAQVQAETFAVMNAFIKLKQEELETQGALVLEKMKDSGQRLLTFKDEWGVAHRFEVLDVDEKLKYTKKEAAAA